MPKQNQMAVGVSPNQIKECKVEQPLKNHGKAAEHNRIQKLFPTIYMVAREITIQQTIRIAALNPDAFPEEKSHIKPAIKPNAIAYPSRSCMDSATINATTRTGRTSK